MMIISNGVIAMSDVTKTVSRETSMNRALRERAFAQWVVLRRKDSPIDFERCAPNGCSGFEEAKADIPIYGYDGSKRPPQK